MIIIFHHGIFLASKYSLLLTFRKILIICYIINYYMHSFVGKCFNVFLLFSYRCLILFPIAHPYPTPPHSHSQSPPMVRAHESSVHAPLLTPSPSLPCYPPPSSPLLIVSLFFISKYLVLLSSFVCFVD